MKTISFAELVQKGKATGFPVAFPSFLWLSVVAPVAARPTMALSLTVIAGDSVSFRDGLPCESLSF
jgi:hypothetical protein